ncbi:hypothetical protein HK22_04640 [Gluconobacter sp. DsW_056]|uniref:hypothetical protein n=1 Tax=Gluconobacter sp. DsW_056 TaxID=1511209 RepID=UPI000A384CC2|nr:hypothetical protein [Gluconobacter sp. DsW_056]OUI80742.1 hypothetical protein HK22_04640 [Gluconobacter sp. DsW_056]
MIEKNIIIMQAVSAILMGSDYFMPEPLRKSINEPLREYFLGVKERSLKPFPDYWKFFWENKKKTIYPLIFVFITAVFFKYIQELIYGIFSYFPWLPPVLILFWLAAFSISVALMSNYVINQLIVLIFLAAPITGVSFFLEKSGKGPMAAIGFVVLMISFFIRYNHAHP